MSAAGSRVRRVNPLYDPQWDEKIARCPGGSFFHGADWAEVLTDTYGFRPCYFVHEAEGQLRGLLPIMEVDSWLTGRRGISLPFTDECEPLGTDPRLVQELVQEAGNYAAKREWDHWELRGGTQTLGIPAAVAFHGHTVELNRNPEIVFARCHSAVRRAVRKAEASEITIRFSQSMETMRAFHALLCKTRRRHGLPPQPWRFFENIQRHVLARQHGCIVLASHGGVPIAGAVFFHFAQTAIFKFGASDVAYQHLRPNNLVMWRAIEWHARAGFSALDLGRTSLANEGLRHFKLSWGAKERRMEYARFDCQSAAFVTTKDRSSGWHSSVFKLVPQSLARLIGALAYKHVA
jgi:CelD/BcsL family acetyltransferase involved in cellulose biosynthesis